MANYIERENKDKERYINFDKLIDRIFEYREKLIGKKSMTQIISQAIEDEPIADVREVKRGVPIPQYITINDYDDASSIKEVYAWRCPFCGSTKIAKFCADCGAEMEMKE